MSPNRERRESDPAARAKRALERGATTLGARATRSVQRGWRRMSPSRRAKFEQLAANVKERAVEPRGEVADRPVDREVVVPVDREVSEVEVHDLRADLARELERLADASIRARRGPGGSVAGGAASADGQA